ncbi:diguanylate cyclase with GGDEF domain [Aminicella lysinilytica]|uniref:Diguanylate cyclase with GGDEF domain n=1 Tax=Aminicella lysinilytica TaxID=433323 RepID=A0A4R6PYZ2_9FIRM|nr:diguanylate cyclase with GGDEF domain [Aminicella lysinilytica]
MDGRDEPFTLSVSMGVFSGPVSDNVEVETIIKHADEEMYKDKKRNGNINIR